VGARTRSGRVKRFVSRLTFEATSIIGQRFGPESSRARGSGRAVWSPSAVETPGILLEATGAYRGRVGIGLVPTVLPHFGCCASVGSPSLGAFGGARPPVPKRANPHTADMSADTSSTSSSPDEAGEREGLLREVSAEASTRSGPWLGQDFILSFSSQRMPGCILSSLPVGGFNHRVDSYPVGASLPMEFEGCRHTGHSCCVQACCQNIHSYRTLVAKAVFARFRASLSAASAKR